MRSNADGNICDRLKELGTRPCLHIEMIDYYSSNFEVLCRRLTFIALNSEMVLSHAASIAKLAQINIDSSMYAIVGKDHGIMAYVYDPKAC